MKYLIGWLAFMVWTAVANAQQHPSIVQAKIVLDAVYTLYSTENSPLLRENFPHDNNYRADYLVADGTGSSPNRYAYLWPFSGTLSAASTLFAYTKDARYLTLIDERILPALQQYYDDSRTPAAYASYIRSAGVSDRFYDDNIWLGIDFAELYLHTGRKQYLDKAKEIWAFILSGQDQVLGGGIYWCEQKKESKNTCSNAPAAVFALRMFEATKDSAFLEQGKVWYTWTKQRLQDPADGLYWDNVRVDGRVDQRKYPYNSGQMLQSAALLYGVTGDATYLNDAQRIAKSGYDYFFDDTGQPFRRLKRSDNWFIAVMLRGYVELYRLDGNGTYLDAFKQSLDDAWKSGRDANGLFGKNWKNSPKEGSRKWLLDQVAMVEMYARMAGY
ncbi:Glycosyl hydrolase family 76 [Parapedobacter composti]|uniref:Glycosyl hydrolase family 76 n=1 Tax=Parapedobacter composti TaxID=623281 RepID=A0A1I1F5Q8_9SPHI|nr:glycoside hydrolase family 76 protein [Parapedobacter composti]SFB94286.1 Glycosyl hydrolase family 76 [Parapedobacter composti]